MKIIKFTSKDKGQRIDKYIRKYLNNAPLSFIYKLFRKKDIKVNGKKIDIGYIINENDEISIYINDETLSEFPFINTFFWTFDNGKLVFASSLNL